MITVNKRIEMFMKIMLKSGINEDFTAWLIDQGFFSAPASTKYHGNYEGGLFDHSLAVTESLIEITEKMGLEWEHPRSPYIVGMFHDLCKVDQYEKVIDVEGMQYMGMDEIKGEESHWEYRSDSLFPGHGDPESIEVKSGKLKPWRTAAEIIDWSIPCPSIFERKKPLVENTLIRIAKGIQKFVINNPEPFIIQYHSFKGQEFRGQELDKPLSTLDTSNRYGLVVPFLTKYFGGFYEGCGNSVQEPTGTLTTKGRLGLAISHIIQMNHNSIGQPVTEPINTITAGANHFGEVRTFLMTYYGNSKDIGEKIDEPLRTITSKDRFGLVTIKGQDYQIVDIGMRMLEPHELFAAQGFPKNYIIDHDYTGKAYPKTEQVARCGNAVPPPFAEALVRANLPELCDGNGKFREVG